MKHLKLFFILLALCCSTQAYSNRQKSLSPRDYGIAKAKSGTERYLILKQTHTAAISKGCNVSYEGIESIDIEIPKDATPIPLTDNTDFAGVTINVTNNSKDIVLFAKSRVPEGKINLEKSAIDNGNFTDNPTLKNGKFLLSIKDENKWVNVRNGHSYGHYRKDILLIEDGKAVNSVIMPYSNPQSKSSCTYYVANNKPIVIKNLTFNRIPSSRAMTFLVEVTGCNNVLLENITTNTTPVDSIIGDNIIRFMDCTNVLVRKTIINGTYSGKDKLGYGISMDNIWNFQADSLYADGNWGVFGTRNVNTALIKNSDINRFDIHCYGKDITFDNSVFRNWYNKFSSVYGNISYRKCHFIDFTPYKIDYTYNAYVPNNLSFEDCIWDVTAKHHGMIDIGYVDDRINSRLELKQKCWPNVSIHNLKLNMDECVKTIILFHVRGEVSQNHTVGNISDIEISGIEIVSKPAECKFRKFILSDAKVTATSKVAITIDNANSKAGNVISPDFRIPCQVPAATASIYGPMREIKLRLYDFLYAVWQQIKEIYS